MGKRRKRNNTNRYESFNEQPYIILTFNNLGSELFNENGTTRQFLNHFSELLLIALRPESQGNPDCIGLHLHKSLQPRNPKTGNRIQTAMHALERLDALAAQDLLDHFHPNELRNWLSNPEDELTPDVVQRTLDQKVSKRKSSQKPFNRQSNDNRKPILLSQLDEFDAQGRFALSSSEQYNLTENHKEFLGALLDPNIKAIFCDGPAGAGKTFWASYALLKLLEQKQISRAEYTTRTVEAADESVGFLKGGLREKTEKYRQGLYENLTKILAKGDQRLGQTKLKRLTETGKIADIALGFERGRTKDDMLCIVDEAQNMSEDAIWLELSRLGKNSKIIFMGDTDMQVDVAPEDSGFAQAMEIYGSDPEAATIKMGVDDIVRSALVKRLYILRRDFIAAARTTENKPTLPTVFRAAKPS